MSRLKVVYKELAQYDSKPMHYAMIYPTHTDLECDIAMVTKNSKTLKGAQGRVKRIFEWLGLSPEKSHYNI